jgi:GTP-binding protein
VFGTRVDQLPTSNQRYLMNSMRKDLQLGPVPLRMTMRASKNPFDQKTK